jgi:hypothetical protein
VCLQPAISKPGTCGPAKKLGEACSSYDECGFFDVWCKGAEFNAKDGPVNGKCTPWPGLGEACEFKPSVAVGVFRCQPPHICNPDTKKCGGPLQKGSACVGKNECQAPLTCYGGVCKDALGPGEACVQFASVECQKGLQCIDKKCGPPKCK